MKDKQKKELIKKNKLEIKNTDKVMKCIKNYYKFYKKNIKQKHVIIYIIALIIFFIVISFNLKNFSSESNINKFATQITKIQEQSKDRTNLVSKFAKEKLPIPLFVIFSGLTPLIPIPLLAMIYPVQLATNLFITFTSINNNTKLIPVSIGCIIQIFAISLAVAAGFYCYLLATKKYRYNNKTNFGISNIKKEYYKIRNYNKKLDEFEQKEQKKKESIESLNVKIPYKELIITVGISTVILIIGAIITRF